MIVPSPMSSHCTLSAVLGPPNYDQRVLDGYCSIAEDEINSAGDDTVAGRMGDGIAHTTCLGMHPFCSSRRTLSATLLFSPWSSRVLKSYDLAMNPFPTVAAVGKANIHLHTEELPKILKNGAAKKLKPQNSQNVALCLVVAPSR